MELTFHRVMFSRKAKAEWISDHRTITDTSAIMVRIERTNRSDWALMVSRSISESSMSIEPSVLLGVCGVSSSPLARCARISARRCLARSKAIRRRWISIQRRIIW
ncbi:hypothetical protein D3C73_1491020 [compost metagenome]